jgi:hypothetical protein
MGPVDLLLTVGHLNPPVSSRHAARLADLGVYWALALSQKPIAAGEPRVTASGWPGPPNEPGHRWPYFLMPSYRITTGRPIRIASAYSVRWGSVICPPSVALAQAR